MKYQKFMRKIIEELTAYKGEVDEMAAAYVVEKEKHEKELEDMRDKYTESYIEESLRNWEPKTDYAKIIDLARKTHQKIAMSYFDKMKSEMDAYFQIPVDSGFAATVTAIKALGVTLNNKEFEVLQGGANGYWGLRLLNEAAISRTKTEQATELENGQTKHIEREVPRPYTGVELPDIEKAYKSLQGVKNALDMAFEGYCGVNCELKDVIFPLKQTNGNFKEEYGIEPPKQMRDTMTITKMANSIKCFDANHHSYTAFSEMMGNLVATMPEPQRKTILTDSDRKLIDTLINSDYPALAQDEAIKIAKADSRLGEILSLDERYGEAVRTALGEVSENE